MAIVRRIPFVKFGQSHCDEVHIKVLRSISNIVSQRNRGYNTERHLHASLERKGTENSSNERSLHQTASLHKAAIEGYVLRMCLRSNIIVSQCEYNGFNK